MLNVVDACSLQEFGKLISLVAKVSAAVAAIPGQMDTVYVACAKH